MKIRDTFIKRIDWTKFIALGALATVFAFYIHDPIEFLVVFLGHGLAGYIIGE